jgi:hypothetical protein
MPGPKNWSAMSVGTPSRLQYTADLRQFRGPWLYIQSEARQDIAFHLLPVQVWRPQLANRPT